MPNPQPKISPKIGETKINVTVFKIPLQTSPLVPTFTSAAPIIPPIKAWEELVGSPKYQVIISQLQAPIRVPKITPLSTIAISIIPLPIVLATWSPKKRKAMKLKKAAQATAKRGESTRVETMVAIELAES